MTDEPQQEKDAVEAIRPATEMRLRADRPPVTRLSRKVLVGIGTVGALGIGGAVLVTLRPADQRPGKELFSTAGQARPEGLATLANNYTQLPKSVPRLGPPLPGDLGKPMLDADILPPGTQTPGAQRIAQAQQAAATSALFAQVTTQMAAEAISAPTTPVLGEVQTGSTVRSRKLASRHSDASAQTSNPNRVQTPVSRYVLQAGSIIPAALITGLRSDLPGEVTAQVTEDVYDSPTGTVLLIPQGSRLLGQYSAHVSYGQTRAFLVWTRLIMPNGNSIVLEREPATDAEGYAGLEDGLDNHWGELFEGAMLSTILSVGAEAGTTGSGSNLAQALRVGASQSIDQAGERIVGRSLNVQPTITIRPGFPVRVLVTRDLVLEPYSG
jgi:type IV secretion system protein VirB10